MRIHALMLLELQQIYFEQYVGFLNRVYQE